MKNTRVNNSLAKQS